MKSKTKKFLILIYTLVGFVLPYVVNGEMRPANAHRPIEGVDTVKVEVTSSENMISLNYQVPTANITILEEGFRCVDNVCYKTRVRVGNASIYKDVGKAIIPKITAIIIIPPDKKIETIDVERNGINEIEVEHFVEFGQNFYPLCETRDTIVDAEPNPSIYDFDNPYPNDAYKLTTVQKKCGVNIAYINLYPVSYYPISSRIISFNYISLIVDLSDITNPSDELPCRPDRVSPLEMRIENPEALDLYSCTSPPEICNPSESYNWVMITSQAIIDAPYTPTVNDLKAHRESQGLSVKIITMKEIRDNDLFNKSDYPPGQQAEDDAVRVRNFIKYAYTNWNTKYVLLGGDENVIPHRKIKVYIPSFPPYTDYIPSDIYFQCLDGPYNYNNNQHWGETDDGGKDDKDVDLESEIFVGRACAGAGNIVEMSNFIHKTKKYEETPDYVNYFRWNQMVGEYLNINNEPDWIIEYGKPIMEEIRLGSSAHGYTTKGFYEQFTSIVHTLYDKDLSDEWSRSAIKERIEGAGRHIFNHVGHAEYNKVMRCSRGYVDGFTNDNLAFLYSQGCSAGNFEEDCVAEHIITSTRYGMFGGVLNSRAGFGNSQSTDSPSQRYNRPFWHAYIGEGISRLGEMNAYSHEYNIDWIHDKDNCWSMGCRFCYFTTNLLCDPYTPIIEPIYCNYERLSKTHRLFKLGGVFKVHNKIATQPEWPPFFPEKNITLIAGEEIRLKLGFSVSGDIEFKAKIDPELYLSECEDFIMECDEEEECNE